MADKQQRPPKAYESIDWAKLYRSVGLDAAKTERLTHVLVVHFLIDRLLTLYVVTKLLGTRSESMESTSVEKAIGHIDELNIPTRLSLALALGTAPSLAEQIGRFNSVRNRLLHFKPKVGSAWDVSDVKEIGTEVEAEKCLREGIEALQSLFQLTKGALDGP